MASQPDLAFLRQVVLFQDLAEADLAVIWPRLAQRRLRRGEILFRQGDPGNELFVVRSGQVVVSKHVKGRVDQVLATFGPGEFFGEMSLFDPDRQPRSATVQADQDTVLLSLDAPSLERLIETNPRAASAFFYRMVQVFIRRLRESGDLVAEVTRWGLEATGLDVEHT